MQRDAESKKHRFCLNYHVRGLNMPKISHDLPGITGPVHGSVRGAEKVQLLGAA